MHLPTPQVAIVTGALGGIGRATVRRLLQDGWAVAASYAQGWKRQSRRWPLRLNLAKMTSASACTP